MVVYFATKDERKRVMDAAKRADRKASQWARLALLKLAAQDEEREVER